MKPIIYTVAYGGRCWHEAFTMVKSLRTFGQYDGEIVVFAEHRAEIPGATVVTDATPISFFNAKIAKAYFGKTMALNGYDKVLFLDTDIVAVNPIAPLLAVDGLHAAADYGPETELWLHSLPELPLAPGKHGFNTGTICCPAEQWNQVCNEWWDKTMEVRAAGMGFKHIDQPVFNHLHNSGRIQVKPFAFESVFIWLPDQRVSKDTILIHVTQLEKRHTMTALLELRESFSQ